MERLDFKQIIKDKGFTQKHVAKKIGVNETLLSQYLSNNVNKNMPEEVNNKLVLFLIG